MEPVLLSSSLEHQGKVVKKETARIVKSDHQHQMFPTLQSRRDVKIDKKIRPMPALLATADLLGATLDTERDGEIERIIRRFSIARK